MVAHEGHVCEVHAVGVEGLLQEPGGSQGPDFHREAVTQRGSAFLN